MDEGLLTFHFGFDLSNPLGKLLLEVERLQPLLVVVDPARKEEEEEEENTWSAGPQDTQNTPMGP